MHNAMRVFFQIFQPQKLEVGIHKIEKVINNFGENVTFLSPLIIREELIYLEKKLFEKL